MFEIRNAKQNPDGSIDCEVNHPSLGWLPTTATAVDQDPEGQARWQALQAMTVAPPTYPDHATYRAEALQRLQKFHAQTLRGWTGDATTEERDTWKPKEEAARAHIAGTATAGQTAMLTTEAGGIGISLEDHAAAIVGLADAFASLIGVAGALRGQGKTQLLQITDPAQPIEGVGPAIDAVFAQLAADANTAFAEWNAQAAS